MKIARLLLRGCIAALSVSFCLGQGFDQAQENAEKRPVQFDNLLSPKQPAVQPTSPNVIIQPNGVPLEAVVDPSRYIVGPSDGIAVNIWLSPPYSFTLTVTPEGTLIIPTVGEVRVADLPLAKAREVVTQAVRKKYIRGDLTVTLVRPRPIVVSVIGNVLNPGLYTVTSVDRANRAVEEANAPTQLQRDVPLERMLETMSRRNVALRHKDGSEERVDIVKFLATHDEKTNPTLREGDVVIVPRRDLQRYVFGIYGEVNTPGRYEFVQGDSLLDALQIGQGFTPLARQDSVLLSRLSLDGTAMTTRVVDLASVLQRKEANIALEPGDRIVVTSRRDLREDYRVEIRGEVRYPGIYPITRNQTRLSDVIREAGGLTPFAALPTSQIYRRHHRLFDLDVERALSLQSNVDPDDTADVRLHTEVRLLRETVNTDFVRLFVDGDSTQDVVMETGDSIAVPSLRNTVYVFGQVAEPGYVSFQSGKGTDFYVDEAGGYTDKARTGGLRVIKGRTRQWLAEGDTDVEPGDMIWVPHVPERNLLYYMTIYGYAASILSVVVGIAVVAVQLRK